jgi:hypothetical protein
LKGFMVCENVSVPKQSEGTNGHVSPNAMRICSAEQDRLHLQLEEDMSA